MAGGLRTTNSTLVRDRLERMTRGRQIVVLDGPGGYGKTTFGEQLLTAAELAAARVRLARATDGPGLLDAIVRACRRAGLSDLASSTEGAPEGAVDRMLAALSQRADPVVLLVDEAQLLTADGMETLVDLAVDLPNRCRLIIAGRRLPNRTYGRPGSTVVIDAAALRFDASDVALLLGIDVGDPLVVDVMRVTDGWPAAVGLAAANRESDPSWSPALASGERKIVESLLDQLLAALTPSQRDALADLARFPLIDNDIVEHIGGHETATTLLEIGLPMQQVGRWSIIPDALREALRLDRTPQPSLTRWIAFRYADAGELAVATSVLASEGQLDTLAELLASRHWSDLEALGLGTVRVLIEMIGDQITGHPQALLNAVWAADRRDHVLKMQWVNQGLTMMEVGPHRRALIAESAIEAARAGDWEATQVLAAQAVDGALADERIVRGRAGIASGMAHAFRSTPTALHSAQVALDEATANLRLAGEPRWEAYALERSAYLVEFKRGAYARSAEQLEAAITMNRTESRDRLTTLTSYAETLAWLGRTEEARAAATEALTIGRRWGDPLAIGFAAWTLAWLAAFQEDAAATHASLKIVDDNPGPWLNQFAGHEFLVDAALMMTLIDDSDGQRRYRDRAIAHDSPNDELLNYLDARLAAIEGDAERAVVLLDALEGTAYADPGLGWQRALVKAVAELRSGHDDRARRYVDEALHATEQLGLPDLPERTEGRLVRMLAPVWPRDSDRAATSSTQLVMLGGFGLRRGAEDCTPSSGNAATLVKLLALRGQMAVEQMIDLMWPEADAATGRSRLRNLLNRVRTQSGDVVERDGESLLLHPDVVVDIHDFEKAAADAFQMDGPRRAGAARLVLAAHSGELLPADAYEDWAAGPRERLKRRFLSLVDIVIDDSFDKGDLDDAVRWLDVAIAAEPLEEARYIRACEALLVQGRRATARSVGERARSMLHDLGLPPSPQLRTVMRSIDAD